jgi:hypothetical protein
VNQQDPSRTVQTFIDLVQRHEQAFYSFVHNVHSKGSGLFDSLMAWIELFLSYARDGLPEPVDLEFLLPDSGPQRRAIMAEVDAVAQYHYRLKLAHEEKIRRRFEKGPTAPGDLDIVTGIEESDEAELLGTVMSNLHIPDTAVDIIDDDESSDDDDEDEDEDGGHDSDHDSVGAYKQSPMLAPVPDHFGPNAPNDKDRRGSSSSHTGKSGFHRIRQSIDFSRPGSADKDKEIPATPKGDQSPRRSPRPKMSKKKRRRMLLEAEIAPETKAIEEMRPLFMEIVSRLLYMVVMSADWAAETALDGQAFEDLEGLMHFANWL